MNKKLFIAVFAVVCLGFVWQSCKKNSTQPFSTNCKIATVVDSSAGYANTYSISYTRGKISSVVFTTKDPSRPSYTKTIIDTNNIIYIVTAYSTGLLQTDSIYLNLSGLPVDVYTTQSAMRTHVSYTYNSANQLATQVTANNDTINYVWEGGDLKYAITKGTALTDSVAAVMDTLDTYSYYTTFASRAGDFTQLQNLLQYTATYMNSSHILKSDVRQGGTYTITYTYSYDAHSNVARIYASNGFVYNISYNCN